MKYEKSCGCVIIDNDKVLLVKQGSGNWGFPKGHVEENETESETALREVLEETHINVEIITDFRYTLTYHPNDNPNVLKDAVYFLAKPLSSDIKPQEGEIARVEWFSYEDALNIITYDDGKKLLKEVLKYIN